VLPAGVPRVAVEAGVTDYWRKYVGLDGAVVGIDAFGESAPAGPLFKHFGFTVDNVIAAARHAMTEPAASPARGAVSARAGVSNVKEPIPGSQT
jgi:transketolase